jgi:hypothetical protein
VLLGITYLGFLIPLSVTTRLYGRNSTPTRGHCRLCDKRQELTYALGDGGRVCRDCIVVDLALAIARPKYDPHTPPKNPVETVLDHPEPLDPLWSRAFL